MPVGRLRNGMKTRRKYGPDDFYLKQGFNRLIRKGYGERFLPPARRASQIEDVREFFSGD